MNVLTRSTRRASVRALVAVSAVALTAGAASVPAASAATASTSAAIYGTSSPTYDGVYRQSIAILGLHAADVTPDPSAVRWLLEQQCAGKGFSSMNVDPTRPCPPFDGNTYSGGIDTNATAVAAQALIAVGRTAEGTAAATYLKGLQNSDGGWEYTAGAGFGSDPNSTALGLTALDAAGITPTVDPVDYFADLQNGQGLTSATPDDDGGIASPYSNGAPDTLATVQSIPGVGGANLVDVPAPSAWASTATDYPTAPGVDAANVAGWASTWLAAQVDDDNVGGSDLPWAVLSFATTATAKDQAETSYATLRAAALDISANPAALGQAALAAKSLGRTADLPRYANLIAKTLTTAPTASYALSSRAIWSTQAVTVTRTSLTGTPSAVVESINWGDGSSTKPLAASTGSKWSHQYSSAGSVNRTITATLRDAVASSRVVTIGSVRVTRDTAKPTASVTTPKRAAKVSSWKTVRGTSSDVGLGVKSVTTSLTEKRGKSWYAYNGKKWTKKSSSAKAAAAAKRIVVTPNAKGAWSLKVAKLKKGSLKVHWSALDKAGNRSATKTKTVSLTK